MPLKTYCRIDQLTNLLSILSLVLLLLSVT